MTAMLAMKPIGLKRGSVAYHSDCCSSLMAGDPMWIGVKTPVVIQVGCISPWTQVHIG
jgi:hypothetical protein